jgi:ribonuclease VapC
MNIILDSYAVLVFLQGEPGVERVKKFLVAAQTGEIQVYLPVVNLGEIIYIIERRLGLDEAQSALSAIKQLPLAIFPADEENVLAAAHIKAQFPVSYADAFVIAAALTLDAVILTGDPEFDAVKELVELEKLP